ncbi:MAG: PD40 domain-containing protein [Chloroflexi bacterium]|nr:PD40 domain-containing protein [Chloroflexota bacterium]
MGKSAKEPANATGSVPFDWLMVGLASWVIAGIFLVGRAYNRVPAPDSLFSPWHLILYSGIAANVIGVYASLAVSYFRTRDWRQALSTSYKLYSLGLAIILVGGLVGLAWQQFFGIGKSIRSLPSPAHLALAFGSVLIMIGPLYSAWQQTAGKLTRSWARMLPVLLSLTYAFSIITFFAQFAHPLVEPLAAIEVSDIGVHDEIYVMNADGTAQTRVTISPKSDDWNPSWSPDGSKIAFVSKRNGISEIYVINADGSEPTRLTFNKSRDWDSTWSPDGSKIAFASRRDADFEIYVMNADGSEPTRLTHNDVPDWNPTWSPDGSKIAFASERDGNSEIYAMNADGTNQTNLTQSKSVDTRPSWSPDGSKIAFASDRDGDFEIYVMNIDGTNPVSLTSNRSVDRMPLWSPDGSKIAFASERDGNFEIYVMNADGTEQTNLTNSPGNEDSLPSWSPDGSKIAFASSGRPRPSPEGFGMVSIAIQAALMMGFVLWAMRRWPLPAGSMFVIFTVNAVLMSTQEDTFQLIPVAVLAGVAADILIWLLKPLERQPLALRVFSFSVPAIYYAFYFAVLAVTYGLEWPVELWSGSILLAGFMGLLLSYLLMPTRESPDQSR